MLCAFPSETQMLFSVTLLSEHPELIGRWLKVNMLRKRASDAEGIPLDGPVSADSCREQSWLDLAKPECGVGGVEDSGTFCGQIESIS